MRAGIGRLERRVAELKQFDVAAINQPNDPKVLALEQSIESTLATIYGAGSHEYNQLSAATNLDYRTMTIAVDVFGTGSRGGPPPAEVREEIGRLRDRAAVMLQEAANSLKESLADLGQLAEAAPDRRRGPDPAVGADDIFIVHGQDGPAKIEAARFIERAGLKAIVLHEQPNEGRTIIEKFEKHAGGAGFAIVVATDDDVGGRDAAHLRPRARQNVIGEMFWFAGALGRDRVCVLKKGDIEMPSDFAGVGYIDMDDRGAWRMELAKELKAAGYQGDWMAAMA
jgi:predicted nucleotide-binding protein